MQTEQADTSSDTGSLSDVEMIDAILSGTADTEDAPTADADTTEVEETEDQADDATSDEEDSEGQESDDDEDAATDDNDGPIDLADLGDRKLTLRMGDQSVEVTAEELARGYQRQSDYTRKTQEIANQRRQIEAQEQHYAALLPQIEQMLSSQMTAEPDWNTLLRDDPIGYIQQQHEWTQKRQMHEAARADRQRLEAASAQREREVMLHNVLTAMPEWRDDKIGRQAFEDIVQYGAGVGVDEAEIRGIVDHRILIGLYKAAQYDKLTAKAKAPKPVAAKPSAPPVKPSAAPVRKTSEVTRAKQRFAKTRSTDDAVSLIDKLL